MSFSIYRNDYILVAYIKETIASLKNINDELTRNITIKKISDTYNVPLDMLENELAKTLNIPQNKDFVENTPKVLDKKKFSKYDMACINIIYFMLNDGVYIEKFKNDLGYFKTKKYRNIANEIIYYYELYKNINIADFITFISNKDDLIFFSDAYELVLIFETAKIIAITVAMAIININMYLNK